MQESVLWRTILTEPCVGIALGQAVDRALGDRKGIVRYGCAHCPLDETLTRVVVDVSGRPFLVYELDIPAQRIGSAVAISRQSDKSIMRPSGGS